MKKTASLLILAAGILWGSMGLFVRKLDLYGLTSIDIVALRAMVTSVFLFLFLLIFRRKLLRIRLRDLWCFLGTGIASIAFFNFCYFKAITLTSLSAAAVLLYTAPAIVMVLSRFLFGERFTKRKLLALFMTFFGCVLVTGVLTEPGNLSAGGILAGLGAGLGYALYSVFSRYALERGYHSLTITFYTFLIAAVGTVFMADIGKVGRAASDSASMLLFCIAFGVLCTVVPYLTYTLGLQFVENSRASIIASVEPVTATLLGLAVFGEKLSAAGAAGVVLVLAALVLCREPKKKRKANVGTEK
ncbi:MAG: DMT family transporter [Clostridiales bacterium]|nr:DMT family transporter [Clostridiales bacterium]